MILAAKIIMNFSANILERRLEAIINTTENKGKYYGESGEYKEKAKKKKDGKSAPSQETDVITAYCDEVIYVLQAVVMKSLRVVAVTLYLQQLRNHRSPERPCDADSR